MNKIIVTFIMLLSLFFTATVSANMDHANKNKFISYTDVGQGEPLLLIHAFPTDQTLWSSQQEKLKPYFRVITLDLWGFGRSAATNGTAVTMTDYAREIKKLLDRLHIKKAIVGGESMGGYIALAFLETYPNKVEGLILSDTQSIADSLEAKAKREALAVDVLENGTARLIEGFMPKALSPMASDSIRQFLRTIVEKQSSTAMASALRGMALREDTSYLLSNSVLPILIMTGDQDAVISSEQSENMHQLAKNSKLVVITNAGHLSSLEQPAQWNQAVIEMFYHS